MSGYYSTEGMMLIKDKDPIYEGCDRCSFRKKPSADTCKGCKSGDRWNGVNWDDAEEVERIEEAAFTEYVLGGRR